MEVDGGKYCKSQSQIGLGVDSEAALVGAGALAVMGRKSATLILWFQAITSVMRREKASAAKGHPYGRTNFGVVAAMMRQAWHRVTGVFSC